MIVHEVVVDEETMVDDGAAVDDGSEVIDAPGADGGSELEDVGARSDDADKDAEEE